ncbi:hypothetical protein QBC32DRAFT_218933, partial [Pseudoneurospora amorphoporcata]
IADADWHLTVFMGHDVDNLVIHGHIYIVWDHTAMFGMRIMRDATARKHPHGESHGPTAYWSLC